MSVHKRKDMTKDGRAWVFQISYITYEGNKKGSESHDFSEKKVEPNWIVYVFYTVLQDICLNGFKNSNIADK